MAIYLDTNVLRAWPADGGIDRVALSLVADQLEQKIVIPSLVVDEAAAALRRDLEAALAEQDKAIETVNQLFGADGFLDYPSVYPDVDELVDRWKENLTEWAEIAPTSPAHMVEGIHREIAGSAPATRTAKGGTGARDAAIWATIREHHGAASGPGHLVTNDSHFGRSEIHESLLDEIGPHSMTLHKHVGTLLDELGEVTSESPISVEQLGASGVNALVEGLRDNRAVARAILDPLSQGWHVRTRVLEAKAVEVISTRRYTSGATEVQLVEGVWQVRAELLAQREAGPQGFPVGQAMMRVRAKTYIADRDSRLLDATVEADIGSVKLIANDDQSVSISWFGSSPDWSPRPDLE